jgi:hypothetical protein
VFQAPEQQLELITHRCTELNLVGTQCHLAPVTLAPVFQLTPSNGPSKA